jgi:uncharacterized protein HemX
MPSDHVQTYQVAVLAAIGLVTAVFGWYHSKRLGVAAAQRAAREAHKDVIDAQRERLSLAMGEVRLLRDTIAADEAADQRRDHELEQCQEERDRERRIYEAAIEQFEWLQAAVWSEDADELVEPESAAAAAEG